MARFSLTMDFRGTPSHEMPALQMRNIGGGGSSSGIEIVKT